MKIAYGVHGYGRGHAMRALAVLPELTRRHEVLVLAGDDAYAALADAYDAVPIPTFTFVMKPDGRRSRLGTVRRNLPGLADLKLNGPVCDLVAGAITAFRPDVIISDSEPWTHHVARRLRIPRISFDHFAILAYCDWPMAWADRLRCGFETLAYRRLMGEPERMVVASFFEAPPRREGIAIVGPVLRPQVRELTPSNGDHLLVYFSNGQRNYADPIHDALKRLDRPVWVYGTLRSGRDGNVRFRPISKTRFLADLAACHAVFATAGNQLISEAMHFGKPLLLMPEDSLEQRLNATTVERLAYGLHAPRKTVSIELLRRFLAARPTFAANLRAAARDGAAEAVAAIERYAEELAGG
ncbi:MAG: glycosyltransferase family protein [Planctomycetota bacterium]